MHMRTMFETMNTHLKKLTKSNSMLKDQVYQLYAMMNQVDRKAKKKVEVKAVAKTKQAEQEFPRDYDKLQVMKWEPISNMDEYPMKNESLMFQIQFEPLQRSQIYNKLRKGPQKEGKREQRT